MPTSLYGAPAAISSRATPAACASPDDSPATNMISRTAPTARGLARRSQRCGDGGRRARARERRQRLLDVIHDGERDGERFASVVAAHRHLSLIHISEPTRLLSISY